MFSIPRITAEAAPLPAGSSAAPWQVNWVCAYVCCCVCVHCRCVCALSLCVCMCVCQCVHSYVVCVRVYVVGVFACTGIRAYAHVCSHVYYLHHTQQPIACMSDYTLCIICKSCCLHVSLILVYGCNLPLCMSDIAHPKNRESKNWLWSGNDEKLRPENI